MAAVGMRKTKVHHHKMDNFFCCCMRFRKRNKNENFTLMIVVPSNVAAAYCSFSL